MSSASIGSRRTSRTIRSGVRRSGRGSSLYPSLFSLTCASASLRPGAEWRAEEASGTKTLPSVVNRNFKLGVG